MASNILKINSISRIIQKTQIKHNNIENTNKTQTTHKIPNTQQQSQTNNNPSTSPCLVVKNGRKETFNINSGNNII